MSTPHPGKKGSDKEDSLLETGVATVSLDYCFITKNTGVGGGPVEHPPPPSDDDIGQAACNPIPIRMTRSRLAFTRCRRKRKAPGVGREVGRGEVGGYGLRLGGNHRQDGWRARHPRASRGVCSCKEGRDGPVRSPVRESKSSGRLRGP